MVACLIFALLQLILCVHFCGKVAKYRGRSIRKWKWLGAIFGLPALAVVLLLPSRVQEEGAIDVPLN